MRRPGAFFLCRSSPAASVATTPSAILSVPFNFKNRLEQQDNPSLGKPSAQRPTAARAVEPQQPARVTHSYSLGGRTLLEL